jgi:NadR type nicotinamide-nucleotide adenylyltransferase
MEKVDERNTVLKVVITGPESTGKTALCKALANHFKTSYVPEYSRSYLQQKEGNYSQKDLTLIAEGQIKLEDEHQQKHKSLLICDTSLEVIRVWSEWKYGNCDEFIINNAVQRTPDLFLLLTPDLLWHPDPLRENPDDRTELFAYYQKTLSEYDAKVVIIRGDREKRLTSAIEAIEDFTKNNHLLN